MLAAGETLEDRALGHAVEIAINQGMLDEVALFDLPLEIGTVEKEIMDTVDLTGSHWSRRRGHHVPGIRVDIAQLFDHRVLAHARWPRNDEHACGLTLDQLSNLGVALSAECCDLRVDRSMVGGYCDVIQFGLLRQDAVTPEVVARRWVRRVRRDDGPGRFILICLTF
jgi:hypothetical protein